MKTKPLVTVLMSVHNGERFLKECIDSVLAQTMSNYEFIIIDDASTDGTSDILHKYSAQNKHIRVVVNAGLAGLTKSLNTGIGLAKGDYIARIDCDDICMPDRLKMQYLCLEESSVLAAVGSWASIIDENGSVIGSQKPIIKGKGDFTYALLRKSHRLLHPSVMLRKSVVEALGGYDETLATAQDYDLWVRMACAGHEVSILKKELIEYRKHSGQVTAGKRSEQKANKEKAYRDLLRLIWKDDAASAEVFFKKDKNFWVGSAVSELSEVLKIIIARLPEVRACMDLDKEAYADFKRRFGRFLLECSVMASRKRQLQKADLAIKEAVAISFGSLFSLEGLSAIVSLPLGLLAGSGNGA